MFFLKKYIFPKNKVSFSGAIFPPKVFLENYKKMEAAAAAAAAAAKKIFFGQTKVPVAIGQPEENGF